MARFFLPENSLPPDVGDWLQSLAGTLLEGSVQPVDIRLVRKIERSAATIYFCRVSSGNHSRMLCVKRYDDSSETVDSLFKRSSRLQPILESNNIASPTFIACNPQISTIAMSFEHGESLEDLVVRSLFLGKHLVNRCTNILDQLAKSQSALNNVVTPSDVRLASPCSNQEYTERIAEHLQHPFVRDCLCGPNTSPEAIIDALPDDFWQRHEKRLLHGDFQTKNILVDENQDVVMIDLDFGIGHPLFDVAQFLTQLIRLSRRWPFARATRHLRHYGDYFLKAYTAQGFQYLEKDLPFFMIWAMTFSLLADANHPRPVRAYIRQHLRRSELAHAWGLFAKSTR